MGRVTGIRDRGLGVFLDKWESTLGIELPTALMNLSANAVRKFWVEWLTKGRSANTLGIVTGNLRNSVQILSRKRRAIMVGTTSAYAPVHEFGIGPYPVREHRKPGVEEARAWIDANSGKIAERMMKGITIGKHQIDLEIGGP